MSGMPWQLREGLKRRLANRVKNAPPKPLVENLDAVSVNDLRIPSLSDPKRYILQNVSFKWPFLAAVKMTRDVIEFHLPSLHRGQLGPSQQFHIKTIRTGIGNQPNGTGVRYAFVCDCGRAVIKLYCLHRRLACRRCQHATYASRTLNKQTRPILQISRIDSFLNEPKLYHRTRQRLLKRLGEKAIRAQGKLNTDACSLWE